MAQESMREDILRAFHVKIHTTSIKEQKDFLATLVSTTSGSQQARAQKGEKGGKHEKADPDTGQLYPRWTREEIVKILQDCPRDELGNLGFEEVALDLAYMNYPNNQYNNNNYNNNNNTNYNYNYNYNYNNGQLTRSNLSCARAGNCLSQTWVPMHSLAHPNFRNRGTSLFLFFATL
jgi:hypothetical protein